MKNCFCFLTILIVLTTSNNSSSQSITAGVVAAGDYYEDINPDTTISQPLCSLCSDSVYLDLNKDGMDDIRFYTYFRYVGVNQGYFYNTRAEALHGNFQVVCCQDTSNVCCPTPYYFYRLDTILLNAPINQNLSFNNHGYMHAGITQWQVGPTESGWANIGDRYVGFRLVESLDTLYGWIRAELFSPGPTGNSVDLIIKDYAMNDGMYVGLNQFADVNHLEIYPNPASDHIIIRTSYNDIPINQIEIYSLLGQLVSTLNKSESLHFSGEQSYYISDIDNGIYIIKLSADKTYSQKIIKH